jgi:hypothetical protein
VGICQPRIRFFLLHLPSQRRTVMVLRNRTDVPGWYTAVACLPDLISAVMLCADCVYLSASGFRIIFFGMTVIWNPQSVCTCQSLVGIMRLSSRLVRPAAPCLVLVLGILCDCLRPELAA